MSNISHEQILKLAFLVVRLFRYDFWYDLSLNSEHVTCFTIFLSFFKELIVLLALLVINLLAFMLTPKR